MAKELPLTLRNIAAQSERICLQVRIHSVLRIAIVVGHGDKELEPKIITDRPPPLISVVTVVYNDKRGAELTVRNVSSLKRDDVEYIVIDGFSDDGTAEVLNQRRSAIDFLVSEADAGIYDAMNKGLRAANGKYVIFMNAGDVFESEQSFNVFYTFLKTNSDFDAVYGDRIYVRPSGSERYDAAAPIDRVLNRMPYCHQSAFVKRDVLLAHPFDQTYRYAADYNQVVQMFLSGVRFHHIPKPVCRYAAAGASESGLRPSIECVKILLDNTKDKSKISGNEYFKSFIRDFEQLVAPYTQLTTSSKTKYADDASTTPAVDSNTSKPEEPDNSIFNFDLNLLKQLDLNKVLFTDRYYIEKLDYEQKVNIKEAWLNDVLHRRFTISRSHGAPRRKEPLDALFLCSMNRPDYLAFINDVATTIDDKNSLILSRFKGSQKEINLKASQLLIQMRSLFSAFDAETPLDRSCLYLRLCEYLLFLDWALELDFASLVTFADMQPFENLLTQYVRKSGYPTATLQHGLYVEYGNFDTVNVANYESHVAEHFFAWGPATADLIGRYHSTANIKICGKPTITVSEASTKQSPQQMEKSYISVVMDQSLFDQDNIKMLIIASKFASMNDLHLNVKFHPQNDREKFKSLGIDFMVNGDLENSMFVIGHTSSLIYELMGRGVKVYKYRSIAPCIPTPDQITFGTVEELHGLQTTEFDYTAFYKSLIAFSADESLDRYRDALLGMLRHDRCQPSTKSERV